MWCGNLAGQAKEGHRLCWYGPPLKLLTRELLFRKAAYKSPKALTFIETPISFSKRMRSLRNKATAEAITLKGIYTGPSKKGGLRSKGKILLCFGLPSNEE